MQVIPFMFFTDQDARYMVRRMSRVRAARIGIGHLFRIAMVGDDQELALDGLQGFDNLADAFRSPHLWRYDHGSWKLRHAVWDEE